MSPVRRRSPRKGKKWLLPLLLALALAALGAALLLLKKKEPVLPPVVTAQSVTLSNREAADIARIDIENRYDAPYALLNGPAGWQMADDADFRLRDSALDAIVNNAALIVAEDTVGDLSEHPEWALMNFGLEQAAARVTVTFSEGDSLAFRIGDSVPQETPAYYFLLEGDSHIYTISSDVFEAYTYTRLGLHDVTDPALKGELIDRIEFSGSDAFTAEKRDDGWYLTAPFVYPLSDTAMDALLKKLEGLRFAQYVGRAEECDLASLGLEPPLRTLTLDIPETVVTGYDQNDEAMAETRLPAYQLTFDLGDSENEVVFYCRYRGEVVKATVFSAGFLRTQGTDSLLLTAPFNAPTNDLSGLILRRDGEELAYEISLVERVLPNNDFELDESGRILYDVAVRRDGQAVDSDAFLAAYRGLLSLRTEDRLPAGWQIPDAAPALTVEVVRSGSRRQVALYPLDALHDAVAVDGVALYRVEKGWAEGISWP